MRRGGRGGSQTVINGLRFEKATSIESALCDKSFSVDSDGVVRNAKGKPVAAILSKHRLYDYLKDNGVDWSERIAKRILPDEALLIFKTKTLHIIEKKYQGQHGSTDEKIQTAPFKVRQYKRLVAGLGIQVSFMYLFNDWFKADRYKDDLEYILECGASYHFNQIPLKAIDL